MTLVVKEIKALETHAVRHAVLRKGRPLSTCVFQGDTYDSTFHLAVQLNGKIIGVATFLKASHENFKEDKQYQLRGMAILDAYQGNSYGRQLLQHAESFLKKRNIELLWCNAREVAWNFYESNGYKTKGTAFHIDQIGTHLVMYKYL